MLRVSNRNAPVLTQSPAQLLGLRRVSWVRITVTDGQAHCEVVGIGHRRPAVHPVSLDTAAALVAGGVPSVIRFGHEAATPVKAAG